MNKQDQRRRNLIGDVFDVLACNTQYITPKMFLSRHQNLEVDYRTLQIRLNKDYVLKLVPEKEEE